MEYITRYFTDAIFEKLTSMSERMLKREVGDQKSTWSWNKKGVKSTSRGWFCQWHSSGKTGQERDSAWEINFTSQLGDEWNFIRVSSQKIHSFEVEYGLIYKTRV